MWIVGAAVCGVASAVNFVFWRRGGPRAATHRRAAVLLVLWALLALARFAAHSPT